MRKERDKIIFIHTYHLPTSHLTYHLTNHLSFIVEVREISGRRVIIFEQNQPPSDQDEMVNEETEEEEDQKPSNNNNLSVSSIVLRASTDHVLNDLAR